MSQPLLNYRVYGENNQGTPLLFLHGMLGELQNWNSQARLFAADYHVIAADLRNHGGSPHCDSMSYREMADDVVYLLDQLGLEQVNLCGHSMGGKTAMQLALSRPERVDRLVVVDIAPLSYPLWHLDVLGALRSLPIDQLGSRREFDAYLEKAIPDSFERAFLLKNIVRHSDGFHWKCNLEAISRNYLKIADFPQAESIFGGEVMFIRGADSNYVQDENKTHIQRYFPHARVKIIDDAGHLPHVQQAKLFSQLLLTFLQT